VVAVVVVLDVLAAVVFALVVLLVFAAAVVFLLFLILSISSLERVTSETGFEVSAVSVATVSADFGAAVVRGTRVNCYSFSDVSMPSASSPATLNSLLLSLLSLSSLELGSVRPQDTVPAIQHRAVITASILFVFIFILSSPLFSVKNVFYISPFHFKLYHIKVIV
jgi:hypothetical protein